MMKNSKSARARRVQRARLAPYRNVSMDSVLGLLDNQEPELDPRLELCCFRRFRKESE